MKGTTHRISASTKGHSTLFVMYKERSDCGDQSSPYCADLSSLDLADFLRKHLLNNRVK